jgi:hypothetical protein
MTFFQILFVSFLFSSLPLFSREKGVAKAYDSMPYYFLKKIAQ